ncbi:TonB family protein [Sphingomonas sp. RHCKR7]|uniref:energy transducer TonB n=1 Tax=Sphingomonas folli TaxID=2862497 RepID=UPI001CA521D1|nr:energy transducer TonB [Sphingomonas folli]MBW6529036.1 TonB family protein [Sphingomonas folli]
MYAAARQDRYGAALASAALTALLGWALLTGLAGGAVRARVDQGLALFRVTPPPPRPETKVAPLRAASPRRSGRAAPANIRSQATQVAAPRPIVVVPVPPPPITVALKPFAGSAPTQGATERVGPGTGAGGAGDGTGSGGWGDGDGGGGGDSAPVWKRGQLTDADYPPEVGEAGFQGTVTVKFLVWTDGRVRDCEVMRSSGSDSLDATTCRLIQRRFRYDPSRDASGRAVPAWILENHEWVIEAEPTGR